MCFSYILAFSLCVAFIFEFQKNQNHTWIWKYKILRENRNSDRNKTKEKEQPWADFLRPRPNSLPLSAHSPDPPSSVGWAKIPPTGPSARSFFVFSLGTGVWAPWRVVSFPTPPAGNRLRSWRWAGHERLCRSSVICAELWNGSAEPSSPRL
jgi:hypothetical protein